MNRLPDSEFLVVWEVIRKYDIRYKIMYGGLCFGMTALVLGSILKMLIFNANSIDLVQFVILAVTLFISGFIIGVGSYKFNEKRYEELKSATNKSYPPAGS